MTDAGGNEEMSRNFVDRMQHSEVLYPLLVQQLNQASSRTAILEIYGCCHHRSAEASIA